MIKKRLVKWTQIKMWILMTFLCFPVFYSLLKTGMGSASLAHGLLIIACYGPLFYVIASNHWHMKFINLAMIIFLIFVMVMYATLNINKDFMFESWALPGTFTFFGGVMGFFLITIQDDAGKVTSMFKVITIIQFLYYLNYSFNIGNMPTYQWGYDMFLGYKILLPAILSLYFFLNNSKEELVMKGVWGGIFAVSVFVILSYGSRGPFIGIGVFMLMKYGTMFMNRRDVTSAKKLLVNIIIIAVFVMILLNFNTILYWFANLLENQGISSRTLNRMLSDRIYDDNGRGSIFSKAISMFNLIGNGPYSDQYYFGEGNYCHNFVIEIFFDFGYLFGTIILAFLVYHLYKILRYSTETKWFGLFAVFFSYSVGRLMFSGTFWSETNFWIMLGLGYLCENIAGEANKKERKELKYDAKKDFK